MSPRITNDQTQPQNGTVGQPGYVFEPALAEAPEKVALIGDGHSGQEVVSYAELDRRCERVATLLAGSGLEVGSRVLLAMSNRLEFVEIAFGALRAGCTAYLIDPTLRGEALDATVGRVEWDAAFVETSVAREIGEVATFSCARARRIAVGPHPEDWEAYAQVLPDAAEHFEAPYVAPNQAMVVFYTAGSTGTPKAITKTSRHFDLIANYARANAASHLARYGQVGQGVYMVPTPLFHIAAFNAGVTMGLCRSWTGVILSGFHAARCLIQMAHQRCTTVLWTPGQAAACARERELLGALDLAALESVRITGGPVSVGVVDTLQRLLPTASVISTYGLTECPVCFGAPPGDGAQPRLSVGKPLPGIEVKLGVDSDGEQSEGELCVRSELIADGTMLEPHDAERRIRDGWLRTGDIFRRDSGGWYYYVGRADDMFVCRGENVYPAGIEDVLSQHPAVSEVCVTAISDTMTGESPAAAVVLVPGASVTPSQLQQFYCKRAAPQTCPGFIEIFPSLPTLGPGKIDRRRVQTTLAASVSGPTECGEREVAEGGAVEAIRAIWTEILGIDSIGLEANFFELGGDSLRAMVAIARLANEGIHVTTEQFVTLGSIGAIADAVGNSAR